MYLACTNIQSISCMKIMTVAIVKMLFTECCLPSHTVASSQKPTGVISLGLPFPKRNYLSWINSLLLNFIDTVT